MGGRAEEARAFGAAGCAGVQWSAGACERSSQTRTSSWQHAACSGAAILLFGS